MVITSCRGKKQKSSFQRRRGRGGGGRRLIFHGRIWWWLWGGRQWWFYQREWRGGSSGHQTWEDPGHSFLPFQTSVTGGTFLLYQLTVHLYRDCLLMFIASCILFEIHVYWLCLHFKSISSYRRDVYLGGAFGTLTNTRLNKKTDLDMDL